MTTATEFEVAFTLLGDPRSKERPRVARGRAYTPKTTVAAESAIKDYLLEHVLEEGQCPYAGPVGVKLVFYTATLRKADLDNKVKLVTDAMNKLVYDDDSQIDVIHAYIHRKVMGEEPRTEVRVYAL